MCSESATSHRGQEVAMCLSLTTELPRLLATHSHHHRATVAPGPPAVAMPVTIAAQHPSQMPGGENHNKGPRRGTGTPDVERGSVHMYRKMCLSLPISTTWKSKREAFIGKCSKNRAVPCQRFSFPTFPLIDKDLVTIHLGKTKAQCQNSWLHGSSQPLEMAPVLPLSRLGFSPSRALPAQDLSQATGEFPTQPHWWT